MFGFGKRSEKKHGAFPGPEEEDELFNELLSQYDTEPAASAEAAGKPAAKSMADINKTEVDKLVSTLKAKDKSARTKEEDNLVRLAENIVSALKYGRGRSSILTDEEKESISDEDYIKMLSSAEHSRKSEAEKEASLCYEDLYRLGFEYRKTHRILTETEKTENREFRKMVGLPHDPDFDP